MNINNHLCMYICLISLAYFPVLLGNKCKASLINERIAAFKKEYTQEDGSILIPRTNKSISREKVSSSKPSVQLKINLKIMKEFIIFTRINIDSPHTELAEKDEFLSVYRDLVAEQKVMRSEYLQRKKMMQAHQKNLPNKQADAKLVANTNS